jgi:aspartate racemase
MSGLAERIAKLSPEKRALLEQRVSTLGSQKVARRSQDGPWPLSFAQERLLFLDRLLPNRAVYNVPVAMEWKGALDLESLQRALNTIIARHEPLRTTFQAGEECNVQVIAAEATVTVQSISLRHLSAGDRERETRRVLEEDARRPFDLSKDVMLRASVVELSGQEHILLLTFHHIAVDGWSLDVFFRELGEIYGAYVNRRSDPELPELSIRYRDYALWQREWLQGDVLQRELSYWTKQLHGVEVLELPTDRPRPLEPSYQGAWERTVLPQDLSERLRVFSREEGVSLFILLLAAFQTLLYRYSGQDDICVGAPVANRTRSETENLIGFFVNTVVMRTDFRGEPRFRELLERVRGMVREAQAHQELPFERLVQELQPKRSGSRSPLFQVMFVLNNTLERGLLSPEIAAIRDVGTGTAKFDLTLTVEDRAGGIETTLEYSTDLFDRATAKRMLGHYRALLEAAVADPDQQVSHMPILGEAEQRQLLVEWNDTKREYPQLCVHQLFEAQADRTPDAIAVVYGNERVSYSELNRRANRLAHHLRQMGVGPDVLVGVAMERSVELVVSLLAILKAGGAYVPLDPDYPQERLRFMIEDTGMAVLVTNTAVKKALPAVDAKLVCLDECCEASDWNCNPVCRTSPNNLAYVMYTSGSTGTPKGVEILHRGIVRLILGVDYVQIDARDVFLQLAPVSFDASTFEIWGSLLSGARCVLFPDKVATSEELGRILAKEGVSTLWLTAGLFNVLVDESPEILRGVRQLLVGGEALSVAHVRRALELLPGTELINGYGPTESTTFACTCHIGRHIVPGLGSIPIGKPIANTKVYVLDKRREMVPIGVPGELCIAGDGLARGYLNRPELTAQRFIQNQFNEEPEARLYKTGDLTRYLPDGNIEFLGRIDDQVKVRGFRIELGEIENALGQHPSIRDCVVVAREDEAGAQQLVAYVMPKAGQVVLSEEMRRFLKAKLPEYMLPAVFVPLPALPLAPNGKVDRRALPAPSPDRVDQRDTYVAPRTPIEEQLRIIWCEVLDLDRISIHDNFFELGGHSMSAVRLFAKISKTFNINLPLATLFKAPTVEKLSAIIGDGGWSPSTNCLVAIRSKGPRPRLFLVHPAGGNVLCFAGLARHLGSDQPVYAVQESTVAGRAPLTNIEEMSTHYLREIRSLQPKGPYHLCGSSFGGLVAFEMARRLAAEGQKVDLLALLDTYPPRLFLWGYMISPRIRYHAGALRRRGWRSKLAYVGEHLKPTYLGERLKSFYGQWKAGMQNRALLRQPASIPTLDVISRNSLAHEAALMATASYKPQAYAGTVVFFKATDRGEDYPDPEPPWRPLVTGRLIVRSVPGTHTTMLAEPNLATLADQLRAAIDETLASRPRAGRKRPPLGAVLGVE